MMFLLCSPHKLSVGHTFCDFEIETPYKLDARNILYADFVYWVKKYQNADSRMKKIMWIPNTVVHFSCCK
jgi:hypothetical protein